MSSAYEIEAEITRRTRRREKLPPFVFNEDDKAYVASLYWKIPCDNIGQFGREFMPPGIHNPRDIASDPVKYPPVFMESPQGSGAICGGFLPVDKGNDIREPKYIPAIERARDIAEKYAKRGFFVTAGPVATKEECAEALKKLEHTYHKMIEMGDEAWRKTGRIKDVVTTARIAATYFGIERDWNERAGEQDVCPYCSRSIKSKSVKCANQGCGAILDWKRARQAGIVSKAEYDEHLAEEAADAEPAKRGPGRPPKSKDEVEL